VSRFGSTLESATQRRPWHPALRRLALLREYPREAVQGWVASALQYGFFDFERLERFIFRTIAKDYFVFFGGTDDDDE
jgi:hypothetical protein